MLGPSPTLRVPEALVGRVAVYLAHRGLDGLAGALALTVEGSALRSAVLRRADGTGELLATAGEVVRSVSSRRRSAGSTVELTVRGSDGSALAVLSAVGVRPQVLPALSDIAAVLGLVLAPVLAPPAIDPPRPEVDRTSPLADVEAERAALADALHDGPLQELVAARYAADAAVREGADPELRVAVQGALVALRRVVWQLRPRGSAGLADALDRLSAQLVERGSPALRLHIEPTADVLPERACIAAYRLVQAVATAGPPTREPIRVRLVRQDAPGGRQVLALSVDGGAPLPDPARWRRTAAALGGDLLCCPARLRLALPAPAPTAALTAPRPPATTAPRPPAPTPKAVP